MTTVHATETERARSMTDPVSWLRQLLVAEAVFTGLVGLLLLAAADALAEDAGLATSGPVQAIGAFFVVLGVALLAESRSQDRILVRLAALNGVADLAWAALSIVVAVTADITGPGRAVIIMQGVLVAAIGETKLVLARRARTVGFS